jgi:hypothetical protein
LTEGVEYVLTANAEDTRLTIAAEATPSSSSFALVVETSFAPQDNLELRCVRLHRVLFFTHRSGSIFI